MNLNFRLYIFFNIAFSLISLSRMSGESGGFHVEVYKISFSFFVHVKIATAGSFLELQKIKHFINGISYTQFPRLFLVF